jgi:hypothetical protein
MTYRERRLANEDKNSPVLLFLILDHFLGSTYVIQMSFFLVKLMNLSTISSILIQSNRMLDLIYSKTLKLVTNSPKNQKFWMMSKPVSEDDFEKYVINSISAGKFSGSEKDQIENLAKTS